MSAPADAYRSRAGCNPRPDGHWDDLRNSHLSLEHADEAAAKSARIFWADISEFQQVVTAAYPYRQLAIRLDTGGRLDNHATANHSAWLRLHRGALIGYVVFIPGQSTAILQRIRGAFGRQLEGIAPMVDMESGAGFAGPGNHSSEANDFIDELASATGSRARELGYANGSDWGSNWPHRPSWMKRVIASYGSQLHDEFFAHQFYGGLNYPVPAGFPRACAPFGSWVDLNTAPTTAAGLLDALGLTPPAPKDWLDMATEAELKALLEKQRAEIKDDVHAMLAQFGGVLMNGSEYPPFTKKANPGLFNGRSLKAVLVKLTGK